MVLALLMQCCAGFCQADVALLQAPLHPSPHPVQKIASLNLCIDALLLTLVERERIDSLTYLSANPQFSPFTDQVKGIYLNHGLAEELVSRNPDLILAGDFGAGDAITLLTRLGFRVERLALPRSLSDIKVHIRDFGALVGREAAAHAMVENIEQKLQQLDEQRRQHPRTIKAFWYSANGVVVGGDTLENELMQRAGFHNVALDKNLIGFAQLDLEELLLAQPEVIIVESADTAAFSLAGEYLHHPALRNKNLRIISLPATLSVCSAPVVADVIAVLTQQELRDQH